MNPFEQGEIATQNEYRPQFWINMINRIYSLDCGNAVNTNHLDLEEELVEITPIK